MRCSCDSVGDAGCENTVRMTRTVFAAKISSLLTRTSDLASTPSDGVMLSYDDSEPLTGSDEALGLVDFSVYPHLEREDMPDTSLANIEKWAAGLSVRAYAIDDQTAIKVVDGTVEVVSEGHWKLFTK